MKQRLKNLKGQHVYFDVNPISYFIEQNADFAASVMLLDPELFTPTKTNRDTYFRAAELGGKTGMRTPDAIHLASAMESPCQSFITNDRKIKSYGNVSVVYVSDL
jgi:predicted nucleic acid-binding protein